MSLGEAAVVAGVTALLKSETLVPVNSNLALRLPLSHSVHPPEHTHMHRAGKRRAGGGGGHVLSGEVIYTGLGERVMEKGGRDGKRKGEKEG